MHFHVSNVLVSSKDRIYIMHFIKCKQYDWGKRCVGHSKKCLFPVQGVYRFTSISVHDRKFFLFIYYLYIFLCTKYCKKEKKKKREGGGGDLENMTYFYPVGTYNVTWSVDRKHNYFKEWPDK